MRQMTFFPFDEAIANNRVNFEPVQKRATSHGDANKSA